MYAKSRCDRKSTRVESLCCSHVASIVGLNTETSGALILQSWSLVLPGINQNLTMLSAYSSVPVANVIARMHSLLIRGGESRLSSIAENVLCRQDRFGFLSLAFVS